MAWFTILKFSKNLYDRPITKKFRKTKNVQLLCQIQENTKCTNVFVKFRKIQNVQTSLCYIVQIISYAGIVYNLRKRVFFGQFLRAVRYIYPVSISILINSTH